MNLVKDMSKSPLVRVMVTDTNHHVRDFLQRELEKEGYVVSSVGSGIEACNCICSPGSPDVVILDPELLSPYGHSLLGKILRQNHPTQIIIHSYDQFPEDLQNGDNIHVVEKNASSIGLLKDKIRSFFQQETDS